jgi:translation initiation factor 4E
MAFSSLTSSREEPVNTDVPEEISGEGGEVKVYEKHLLHNPWLVWYHNPSDTSWDISSYKDILEIHSIEDFIVLMNSWNVCLPNVSEGMFFMMRKLDDKTPIYPQWEDVHNRGGGYWSFKIDNENAQTSWYKLAMFLIAESITKSLDNSLLINGISISPKKNFCIIKIWNNDKEKRDISLLNDEMDDFLEMDKVLYTEHEVNIEKDNNKKKGGGGGYGGGGKRGFGKF